MVRFKFTFWRKTLAGIYQRNNYLVIRYEVSGVTLIAVSSQRVQLDIKVDGENVDVIDNLFPMT